MSLARQFVVNVAAQGLARVLSIAANLALMIVVARTMGPAYFGQFSYVLAFSTIAVALADLGTTALLARGLAQHVVTRPSYLGNFLLIRIVVTLVVMVCACAVAFALQPGLLAALLITAIGLPVLATRFFEPVYQVYGKPWLSPLTNFAFAAAQLLLVLVVWAHPGMTIPQLMSGVLLTNLVYTAVALWLMLSLVRPDMRPNRALLREIFHLAGPLGVSSIFTTIILRADVLILEHLRTSAEVGLYSAAYRLLDFAVFLAITVVTPLIPILTSQIQQDRAGALANCRMAARSAALFCLPVAIAVPVLAPSVLRTVLGPEFEAAAVPLNILVINFVLVTFALLGSSINLANGEVAHGYWCTPLACVINLALNFLLIPRLGIVGAAWATVASQVAMLLVSQFYVVTRFGNLYEGRAWARIAVACAAMWACLHATAAAGPWASVAMALVVYAAAVSWLGLFPREIVSTLLGGLARRRLTSAP